MAKKVTTTKPSGLTLTRKGDKIIAKWKIADKDYDDGQYFQWLIFRTGTSLPISAEPNITKTATSKSFTMDGSKIYPSTNHCLQYVQVNVAGNRKKYVTTEKYKDKDGKTKPKSVTIDPGPSKPAFKKFFFYKPGAPSALHSLTNYYTSTWSVSTGGTDDDHYWIRKIKYQTALLTNSDITDGKKVSGWGPVQEINGSSGSITIAETTSTIASGSHTRWVKIWSCGAAGDSSPIYVRHVYAAPNAPTVTGCKVTETGSSGYNVRVDWSVPAPASRPIDSLTVQYVFATTGSTLSGWQDADVAGMKASTGSLTFSTDQQVGLDQSLYVRVNAKHDNNTTYGAAKQAKVGALKAPSALSVTANDSTFKVDVSATNNSEVAGAYMIVRYMPASRPNGWDIATIPNGQSSVTGVQCPDWSGETGKKFSVRAVLGSAGSPTAQSAQVYDGGTIPSAPGSVALAMTDIPGTINVTWTWAWKAANFAEISWADHRDAWESTDEPETYQVGNINASSWNISGLETGIVWYVRVRLAVQNNNTVTYGPYCDIKSIDLSSAPVAPVLDLSTGAIAEDGDVTVSWTYSTTDGTGQAAAVLAIHTLSSGNDVYTPIEEVQTAQQITINAKDKGWTTGQSYELAVQVTSESGHKSEWSETVTVYVVEPLTAAISATSLVQESVTVDGVTRTINSLKAMPLTVTATGAGNAGTTTVAIERLEDYQVDRPDESQLTGYQGETITLISQTGQAQISIGREDLIGRLDDGAPYKIVATVKDDFGQTATAELEFEVHWTHQALMPDASVQALPNAAIIKITPKAPEGAAEGDTCDIYRLSVDKPELIFSGAEFGTDYVDPFPALGNFGGHRIVFRTADGDYNTEDQRFAWLDVYETIWSDDNIIDFGTGQVRIRYNIDIGSSWTKDFKETQYLGGSIQGDWNPAVSRTGSVAGVVVIAEDPDMIEAMRRLAVWPGICHVRTKDGSSYAADVQVSENIKQNTAHKFSEFSLKITRVDPEGYEAMKLSEWQNLHGGS